MSVSVAGRLISARLGFLQVSQSSESLSLRHQRVSYLGWQGDATMGVVIRWEIYLFSSFLKEKFVDHDQPSTTVTVKAHIVCQL